METDRLKIPLVENNSVMSKELWNNPFNTIDALCMARVVHGGITFPANAMTLDTGITASYQIYAVFLTHPEDKSQWLQCSFANFRVYSNDGDSHIILEVNGKAPTTNLELTLWGIY